MGAADGTVGTEMFGGGGAGALAALPAPLGSLTELLRPPALPTPLIPLTPASWAKQGAATPAASTKARNADFAEHELHSGESVANELRGLAFRIRGPIAGYSSMNSSSSLTLSFALYRCDTLLRAPIDPVT